MDFHGIRNYGRTDIGIVYAVDTTGITIYDSAGTPAVVIEHGGFTGIGNFPPGWISSVVSPSPTGFAVGVPGLGGPSVYIYPHATLDEMLIQTDPTTVMAFGNTGLTYQFFLHPSGTVGLNKVPSAIDSSVILDVNGNLGVNGQIKGVSAGTASNHAVNKAQLDAVSGGAAGGVDGPPLSYDSTTQLIAFAYYSPQLGVNGSNQLYVKEAGLDHGGLSGKGDDDHPQYKLKQGTLLTTTTPSAAQVQNCSTTLVTGNVTLPKCSDVGAMTGEITIINDSTASITVTPDSNDRVFNESAGVGVTSPNTAPGEAITFIVLDDTVNNGRWGIKSTAGGMWVGP